MTEGGGDAGAFVDWVVQPARIATATATATATAMPANARIHAVAKSRVRASSAVRSGNFMVEGPRAQPGITTSNAGQYAPMKSRLPMATPLWRRIAYAVVT